MKLLFVLLVVPMVLAGDFAKMWSEMEEKLKSKGWGEEDAKDGGDLFDSEQDNSWGEKKGQGWGEQEVKGWGADKQKGWGDKNGKEEDDSDDSDEMKESEEREAKVAMYKELERANMMKMLKEKLVTVTHEFLDQKLEFMHSILGHFLDFCKFDFSKDMLKKVYVGSYGNPNVKEDKTQYASFEYLNFMGNFSDIFTALNSSFPTNHTESIHEEVQWFAELDQGEQFKFVLEEYINILCTSAKYVTSVLYYAEPELVSYKMGQN